MRNRATRNHLHRAVRRRGLCDGVRLQAAAGTNTHTHTHEHAHTHTHTTCDRAIHTNNSGSLSNAQCSPPSWCHGRGVPPPSGPEVLLLQRTHADTHTNADTNTHTCRFAHDHAAVHCDSCMRAVPSQLSNAAARPSACKRLHSVAHASEQLQQRWKWREISAGG